MGILDVPDTLWPYIVHNNYYFVVVKCFVEVDKGLVCAHYHIIYLVVVKCFV